MKILSVKNNKTDATFEVELDAKEWKDDLKKEKHNLAKNIQIQGFRKGHAPQSEIDKRISKYDVALRVLERKQQKLIQDIVVSEEFTNSNCLDSISNIEIVKIEPTAVIKVNFELVPKVQNFDINDAKKIVLPEFKNPKIDDTMVKQQIKMMIKPDAMVSVKKDGIVAKGNIAVIDFKGYVNNKPFNGGEGKNYELEIGSKTFIDNFEDQLIGCKKGQKKTVNVSFPKDYGMKDLANKPAKFEVVINEVKEIEYPEITKSYCKKFNMECANMAELEKHIRGLFEQEYQLRYQDEAMKIINQEISKKAKLNFYPKGLVAMHKNQILNQYEQEAKRAGCKNLADYKKLMNIDEKKFEEILDQTARSTLNVSLVYEKLISDFKLKVTDADTKDYLSKLTRYFGDEKKAKDLFEKNKDVAESNILRDKLFKKLIAEAKTEVTKKPTKVTSKTK